MSPSPEAVEHWENAADIQQALNKAGSEAEEEELIQQIVEELALAVSKAGEPFPDARASLAFFLQESDLRKAFAQAKEALKHDLSPVAEFTARVVYARGYALVAGDSTKKTIGWFGGSGIASLLGTELTFQNFKRKYRRAYSDVITSFSRVVSTSRDLSTWLWASSLMLAMGDEVEDSKMLRGQVDFYSPIIEAPWEELDTTGLEEQVKRIIDTAQARAFLQ